VDDDVFAAAKGGSSFQSSDANSTRGKDRRGFREAAEDSLEIMGCNIPHGLPLCR